MPAHDWTRVTAGIFHDFRLAWIVELWKALNGGLLPAAVYAQIEPVARRVDPSTLTFESFECRHSVADDSPLDPPAADTVVALADAPPKVGFVDEITESMLLAANRQRLVIRRLAGDQIVALIDVVSPGNKERNGTLEKFVDKAVAALDEGYQLLILDLFPPGPFDPNGIHGALCDRIADHSFDAPKDRPLTLVAYSAGEHFRAYVEPFAVGDELADMPLFLDPGHYIYVPLEATYMEAWRGVPERWRRVIEGRA